MVRIAWIVGVAVALAAAPSVAGEDDTITHVKKLFKTGTTHYNLAEYKDALADFKEAYRLRPDPVFLYNVGQCYRQMGDNENAARSYRAFLREKPDAPNREAVEKLIAEADAAIAAQRANRQPTAVEAPKGIDPPGRTVETTRTTEPRAVETRPGPGQTSEPDHPSEPSTTPGTTAEKPPAAATTPETPPPGGEPPKKSRTGLWVAIGVVAGVVVVGGAIGLGVGLSMSSSGPTAPMSEFGTFTAVFK